jgi:integrase
MPANKRFKTKYPGVYYIESSAVGSEKPEKIFYIMYRKNGKLIEEKAGRQFQNDMTPAKAAGLRSQRIQGGQCTNKEERAAKKAAKLVEAGKWTVDKLFKEYIKNRPKNSARSIDEGRYKNYLEPVFGTKAPDEILPLEVDKLRSALLKKKAPQTVKHILGLLTWIINYGVKRNLCRGLSFHIQKPMVNNEKTEDLTRDQLKALIQSIEKDSNIQAANLMKMALYTGMRRGELFRLKWADIDIEKGFIHIRDPKGGIDQKIPLNEPAKNLLLSHVKTGSEYVFPGKGGRQRTDINHGVNRIKKRAGLPKDFRPLHGLRHVYASMLASSGEVDLYTLQKLLTHKNPRMTQRYAHLRDEALKTASDLAGSIIDNAIADSIEKEK